MDGGNNGAATHGTTGLLRIPGVRGGAAEMVGLAMKDLLAAQAAGANCPELITLLRRVRAALLIAAA